jgi:outer membrane lipoprotein-sorting protein
MISRGLRFTTSALASLCIAGNGFAAGAAAATALTAEQILQRHVAARGGAEAWHKIETMGWTGHIESGPEGKSKLQFLMLFKRPNATRFEIVSQQQKSVRIFDGSKGWKLRPTSQGVPELADYTAEEGSFAGDAAGLDGPLIDHHAKGVGVILEGQDQIEGRAAYRLRLTLPSGQTITAWVDTHSFLEMRYDRTTRNGTGQTGVVSVYLRDYHTVEGLVLPFTIETGAGAGKTPDRMIIEKIAFNPTLDAKLFARPDMPPQRHHGVLVNTAEPPPRVPPAPSGN